MKTLRWMVFAALTGCLVSALKAQTIVLSGHVTNRTGIYQDTVAAGDQVRFSFDFSERPLAYDGAPGKLGFWVPFTLTVATKNVVLGQDHFGVYIQHDALLSEPPGQGLFVGMGWNSDDGNGEIMQHLLSMEDIVPAAGIFPADIPFSKFYRTDGYYLNQTPGALGRLDWEIDRYTGSYDYTSPPPLSPVPEPSTYGIVAALGLGVLAFTRRRAKSFKQGANAVMPGVARN